MNSRIRAALDREGFVEVETPNLVPSPGTDVYLEAFESSFSGMGSAPAAGLFLHTSPEFFMKELLVGGLVRIYQICKAYRNGELTPSHNPEFTILEFYRAYTDFVAIMDDVEMLVRTVLGASELHFQGDTIDLEGAFERQTVAEVFAATCGLDILALDSADELRDAAEAVGLGPLSAGGSWADLFHQLLVTHVEPKLGFERPVFVTHYPRSLAVLSRGCDDDPRVAERFELYIAGVELCNGFTELNDPVEQRARFEEDQDERRRLELPLYPMPERFLASLEAGMPPAAGVAVGLDRLLMLALDKSEIGDVLMRAVSVNQ
jgi:lysyl-tRNA synthetase class 2